MSHLDSRTSFDAGDLDDGCCGATASACCANTKEDSINTPVSTPSGNPASLVEEETQGYDVEFDPPLESKYECPICLMALREAVQTPCGHRFCKGCIIKSIRDAGPKCPVDNEILQEKQLFPDNFAKREILSLTVKCPSQGCYVKMELRRLEAHLASCEFASLVCKQCQGFFQKNQLDEHMKMDCPKREILCGNCALPMPFEQKQEHEESCPLAYVMCEYCQMNLIRQQIADHYNVDCVMAPISCTYNTFGCTEKMQRNDLARHLQEFTQAHMQMMAVTLFGVSNSLTPTTDLNSIFPYSGRFESRPPSVTPTHLSTIPSHHDCSQEYQNLRETIDQLETRLVRQDHQIRELIAKMETQSASVAELKSTIRNLEDKIVEMEAHQSNGVFLWRIKNFSTLLKNQEEDKPVVIHSLGFYTGRPGYKLCLRLHIQLPSAQRCANYISLFIHTMQGDYDNLLPWPFQGTIRLSILDQSDGPVKVDQEEVMDTKPDLLAFQRPTMQRNPKGFGYVTFMPLQNLKQRQYVKNDTLLVRCVVTTHLDLNSPRREGFQPRSTDCSMQPPV